MKMLLAASVALAALASAVPAAAQDYNAFRDFTGNTDQSANGVNNGNFIYGEYDPANLAAAGTPFTANSNCFISGSTCLQEAPNGDVPGVTKGGAPAFQYNSVFVPQDRLLLHPDDTTENVFAAFVAPTAGTYRLFATFNVQDVNPSGVDIFRVGTTDGGLPLTSAYFGSINAGNPVLGDFQFVTLGAGEAIGYGFGNGGSYNNDSTGLQFQVFAGVPEPTTWAFMIMGFGMVGGAMRRRAAVKTTVRFA